MSKRSENTRPKPGRDPKGKFVEGNKLGKAWQPGVSPNPGGRPASEPGFRQRCREGAAELLNRILNGDFTYSSGPGGGGTDMAGMVKAFEALADRGGLLPADRQANFLVKVLESPALTADERRRVVDELVGPPATPALPAVSPVTRESGDQPADGTDTPDAPVRE